MKIKLEITLFLGVLLGLLLGGMFWQPKYLELSERYDKTIELLRYYKNYVK